MMQQGFLEDVKDIFTVIKRQSQIDKVQKCLFSATFPEFIDELAEDYLSSDRITIDLAQNLSNKTAKEVKHFKIKCEEFEKIHTLAKIL
jgi:superfamily II DNA/RNA helicase